MAKISVVIPAYNAAETIQACLESVRQQIRPADEIIVVDDGSSDTTSDVVSAYGQNIILLSQKNQGSAQARQTGSDAASGEYIAYIDADDWWPNDHLQKVERAVSLKEIDLLFGDLRRAQPGAQESDYSQRNSEFYPWFKDKHLESASMCKDVENLYEFSQQKALNLVLSGFPLYPSTMVIRKKILYDLGHWDKRFKRCQDFDFSLKLARRYKIFYFDEVHAILGLHTVNSDVSSYVLMQTLGDIKVLKTHIIENEDDQFYVALLKISLSDKLYSLAKLYRKRGDFKLCFYTFYEAVFLPKNRIKSLAQLAVTPVYILRTLNA